MKKTRVVVMLSIFFCLIVFASVLTLSVNATDDGFPAPDPDGGKWAWVCCGSMCAGGVDYCVGSGSYTCCK